MKGNGQQFQQEFLEIKTFSEKTNTNIEENIFMCNFYSVHKKIFLPQCFL